MQTIRSFISIPVTAEIRSSVSRVVRKLKSLDDSIKWVPLDNLHLTLKFLGEVDNVEIPAVCREIRAASDSLEPFELSVSGTGGFPNLEKPRVLFAGVDDPTGSLVSLVNSLESRLADLGFKPEQRDYRPHLTIGRARTRSRRLGDETIRVLQEHGDSVFGEMVVDEIELMASFLDKGGPTYQVMDTVEL